MLHDLPGVGAPQAPGGRFPDAARATLTAEGLRAPGEDLPGSITYRRHRVGGTFVRRKEVPFVGALAVTGTRLVVWAAGSKHVDVPFAHPLRPTLDIAVEQPDRLGITYRAGAFHPSRSGRVHLRFATPAAGELAAALGIRH